MVPNLKELKEAYNILSEELLNCDSNIQHSCIDIEPFVDNLVSTVSPFQRC